MPLTSHSQQLIQLLPALRAGVRSAHLRTTYANDALEESVSAIAPHLERLFSLTERERSAYAFVVGSRTAMALRKRVGLEVASGTDAEVDAWHRQTTGHTQQQTQRSRLTLDGDVHGVVSALNRREALPRQIAAGGPLHTADAGVARWLRRAFRRVWRNRNSEITLESGDSQDDPSEHGVRAKAPACFWGAFLK
jgi:hypothetical protein